MFITSNENIVDNRIIIDKKIELMENQGDIHEFPCLINCFRMIWNSETKQFFGRDGLS